MANGGRRQAGSTLTSFLLAGLLSGTGCLRFAYQDVDRQRGVTSDAGMDGGQRPPSDAGDVQSDAQPTAAGSDAAEAGLPLAGGAAGKAAGGGGASGAGQAGAYSNDAGTSDASVLDAAAQDASTIDAGSGVDSGVPGSDQTLACAERPGVVLCNGFETFPFTTQWDFYIINNAVGELSTTTRHSGIGALRASTNSAREGTAARYATRMLNQQMSGDIWMRYYYYLPSTTQITTWISSGVMSEITPPYEGFDFLIHANYVEIESMVGYFDDGVPFPRDRWVCVELHAQVASNGYFEAFLDGTQVARSATGNTIPAAGYSAAEFGIHYAEARQGPVVVYVDDVAVGTARIGCD